LCGHVGIAGNLAFKDEAFMKKLLHLDYFRGTDSTGLASIRPNGDTYLAKVASHPLDLFDCGRFKTALNGMQSSVFIGHNRAATKGKVNAMNAHPFECEHIVGAHNGTLETSSWEALKKATGIETGTDSESIFWAIAKLGIEETVKLLQGAWALVWYDKKDESMFFLRNDERPLWYAFSEKRDKFFWSSEWEILRMANELSGVNQQNEFWQSDEEGKKYRFWQFAKDKLYRINVPTIHNSDDFFSCLGEFKGKEKVVSYTYDHAPFGRVGGGTGNVTHLHSGTTNTSTTTSPSKEGSTKPPPSIHIIAEEPFGGLLSFDEFEQIAKYGCSFCNGHVDFTDKGILVNKNQGIVLCSECTDESDTTRFLVSADDFKEIVNGGDA